jgi:hypothetical protein
MNSQVASQYRELPCAKSTGRLVFSLINTYLHKYLDEDSLIRLL